MSGKDWSGFPMLGFDLETTGVDTSQDRVVSAALVYIRRGHRPATTTWLANPGIDIPEGATEVHGITTEHARNHGRDPATILFELTGRLALSLTRGIPVVGFNIAYDLTLLEHENHRHGIDTLASRLGGHGKIQPIIDPHVLDKWADPYRKGGRTLTKVCDHYSVRHTGAHDAAGDALAACRLFPKVMAAHARKFPGMTLPGLHQAQVGWRREQADSLRAYFDKAGIEHDGIPGDWPTIPMSVSA